MRVAPFRATSRRPPRARQSFVVSGERDAARADPQRRGGNGRDFSSQRRQGRPLHRMHAVRQQNDKALTRRIDPHRSAGKPSVAVRTDRKQLAAIARIRRIDIPAEAAQNRLIGRALRLGEFLDRERTDYAGSAECAAIQHHLRITRQIVGSRKNSRMPRHAAHVARSRVVHHTA